MSIKISLLTDNSAEGGKEEELEIMMMINQLCTIRKTMMNTINLLDTKT